MDQKPRIKLLKDVRRGDVVQVKTLVAHAMENGQRKDQSGQLVPRKIINRFTCAFNGKEVFACELEPAVAPNLYLQFPVKVEESGIFTFSWTDDDGGTIAAEEAIVVT